jgi:hypothetical protein
MRKYRRSEYREYTNCCFYPTEDIAQLDGDCQRRDRARFGKSKGSRQNAGVIREILYRRD